VGEVALLGAGREHLHDEDGVIDHRAVAAAGTAADEGVRVHGGAGRRADLQVAPMDAAGGAAQAGVESANGVRADEIVVLRPARHERDDAAYELVAFLLALLPRQELVDGAKDRPCRLGHAPSLDPKG
jgi:hypothetical protein